MLMHTFTRKVGLWRTPPTPPTVSSSSYHQEDGTGASEPAPPDCSTAFPPGCESPEPKSPRPPLKPHENPYLLKQGPPPPPPPPPSPNTPQPYHTKEKTGNFFVQFKCATHRWVGLYKPPVVTHSPLCALDIFPNTAMCTQSHKRLSNIWIYVCLHAHALLQIILYCSSASCLTHNVYLCTCTVFMWSIRIVCIDCIFYLYL